MKVIVAGDLAPISSRMCEQIDDEKFAEMFPNDLVSLIKDADYSVVNFECPVANDNTTFIEKNGPVLKCSPKAVKAISYVGFRGVTLANNHVMDQGSEGLWRTIKSCEDCHLDVIGIGDNLNDASKIHYIDIRGEKLAIINCCEHEFSIATDDAPGANPLDPIMQFYHIKEARTKANYVVVIVHGGHEHFQLPSLRMKQTYRFFIDAGADAVVNHHQHCFSGYEIYNNRPIFYGLGNFAFDWDGKRGSTWNKGYFVKIDFESDVQFEIFPYEQYGESASVQLIRSKDAFFSDLFKLNEIINDDNELKRKTQLFFESRKAIMKSILEPSQNRWIRFAIHRHLLPSMITRSWLIKMLNIINCEAHRDTLLYYLKSTTGE